MYYLHTINRHIYTTMFLSQQVKRQLTFAQNLVLLKGYVIFFVLTTVTKSGGSVGLSHNI